jgi:hypothetical protein
MGCLKAPSWGGSNSGCRAMALVHGSLSILAQTGPTLALASSMADPGVAGERTHGVTAKRIGLMSDDSEVLDAVCRDALVALVLQASEDAVRRAAMVACVANGVPAECAEVVG